MVSPSWIKGVRRIGNPQFALLVLPAAHAEIVGPHTEPRRTRHNRPGVDVADQTCDQRLFPRGHVHVLLYP